MHRALAPSCTTVEAAGSIVVRRWQKAKKNDLYAYRVEFNVIPKNTKNNDTSADGKSNSGESVVSSWRKIYDAVV